MAKVTLKQSWKRLKESWNKLTATIRSRRWLFLLLLFGAAFAASPWDAILRSAWHPKLAEFFARFFTGIGEAIAISAVIAIVVDEAAKRKLLKEFAENISDHIVGRLLPEKLREQMHEYLTVDFVRHDWNITYDLRLREEWPAIDSPPGERRRFVQLTTTSHYSMENRSPFDRPYVIQYEVVKRWFEQLKPPEIKSVVVGGTAVYCTQVDDSADGFVRLDPEKDKGLVVPMPGHVRGHEHKTSIKLVSLEYLGDTFYTSFDALHPVLNTTLRVIHPPSLDIVLYLSFADKEAAKEITPPDAGITKQWSIDRPILPGQGFLLRWRPLTR